MLTQVPHPAAAERVATTWDPGRAAAMARHGVRVEEELSLDTLLTDLACPGSQASRCERLGRERGSKGSLPITHKWMINFIYA